MSDEWSESVKNFHIHLRELGLVFIRKRKDGCVAPVIGDDGD